MKLFRQLKLWWLTKKYKAGNMYLLSLVIEEPSEFRGIDRHVKLELFKRLQVAESQLRLAITKRSTVMLEFAAIELLTTLDVIRGVKNAVNTEREKATNNEPKTRQRVSHSKRLTK